MRMSRVQLAALDEYGRSEEFKSLDKFRPPMSSKERKMAQKQALEDKELLKLENDKARFQLGRQGTTYEDRRATVNLPSNFASVLSGQNLKMKK